MAISHTVLEGNIVYLRYIKLSDVNDNYLSWLNDDQVMKGILSSGYNLEKLKSYVIEKINSRHTHFFAIITKSSNLHIGNIKLDFHDSKSNLSELGVLIGNKDYWGKGIAKEACSLVLDYGFKKLNLRKIFLAVFESNIHAIKLYESLGFKTEGKLKKHVCVQGVLYDKYFMGIFSKDYLKK
jgi:[ribosomal protein S5]-alanine N-acetyltransferase